MTGTAVSLSSGYLSAPHNTLASPVVPGSGHTFGLLGQGDATNPQNGTAWASRVVSDSASHGMMVSYFPYDNADTTGIASNKKIEMTI